MNGQRKTYTLLPDIPDTYNDRRDIENLQEEYLQEHLGLALWAAICLKETNMDIWRELGPKVRPGIEYMRVNKTLNLPDWLLPVALIVVMIVAGAVMWGMG